MSVFVFVHTYLVLICMKQKWGKGSVFAAPEGVSTVIKSQQQRNRDHTLSYAST